MSLYEKYPSQIAGTVGAENFQISKDGTFMSRWGLADEFFSTRGLGGGVKVSGRYHQYRDVNDGRRDKGLVRTPIGLCSWLHLPVVACKHFPLCQDYIGQVVYHCF